MTKPRNDRNQAVTKFCLSMEEHRRTDAGRVRTAREFLTTFFPHDENAATDRVFKTIPQEVRGPILSSWGIRGTKAALKDDDEKVKGVVHDALVAGDLDDASFEQGITAQTLIDWVALGDWWSFWRQGKLTGVAIQRALATARELELIDDRWFLANVQGRGGRLKGTDILCDTLSKDQIIVWIRKLHESGDGSPAGLVAAIGWDTILTKTAQDVLLGALDAFAKKVELVVDTGVPVAPASRVHPSSATMSAVAAPASDAAVARPREAPTNPPGGVEESSPGSGDTVHEARTDAPAAPPPEESEAAFPISEAPPVDAADLDGAETPTTQEQTGSWNASENPNLVEARAKMMEMLTSPSDAPPASTADGWTAPEPEVASGLSWSEPPAAPPPVEEKKVGTSGPPPLPRKAPARR